MKTQHFFLVSHGSRDSRSSQGLKQLAAEVRTHLQQNYDPHTQVWGSVLELADKPLHQQIEAKIHAYFTSSNPGLHLPQSLSIGIFPLFLQPGTHVLVDLPREIGLAQRHSCQLLCYPYLGAEPTIVDYIRPQLDPKYTWICLAHGSSRPETTDTFAQLHQTLGTIPAYLHHPPFLPETIDRLIQQGNDRLGLFPYFLFPGRLTDAIVTTVEAYKTQYPAIDWYPLPLLSQQIGFSSLIANLLRKNAVT